MGMAKEEIMGYRYPRQQQQRKKKNRVPIHIEGLGTFYVERKYLLLSAGVGTLLILFLAWFLIYIQTVPVCNLVYVGC